MNKKYLPFLVPALLALLVALWAGLLRLGWTLPSAKGLALAHGPLMICGFLGALIALERAVALNRKWMFAAPLLAGLGWLAALLAPTLPLGAILFALASLVAVGILFVMARREPAIHTLTMLAGMLFWLAANLLWLSGRSIFQVVYGWQAYLILTIVGERLELSRVLRPSKNQQVIFTALAALLAVGTIVTLFDLQLGARLSGAGMLALALWSFPADIAWRNIRHKLPLTRYIAWCLALGFIWLGIGGALNLVFGAQAAGPLYDALLHAVFVGFVISMIFGHAPIIFPAILGAPINFQPAFYIQLALLHFSLALRIVSDLLNVQQGRLWGGLLNEIAILLFLGMTIYSVRQGLKTAH
ncbi:MAG: hypothetical protein HFACDABA_01702 [Anaerolineales bacterium]|nr:hypothetical protein [Anaerolineales bacterium]